MDIHKPKPVHGWREFVGEIGVIVIGVLIALGAEQIVDDLHWKERSRRAVETLRAELNGESAPVQAQVTLKDCQLEMLDRLEAALLARGDDWRPPVTFTWSSGRTEVFVAPIVWFPAQAWRSAQADGSATHLSAAEEGQFSEIYDTLGKMQADSVGYRAAVAQLNSLTAPRRLDSQSRTEYLRLLYQVRDGTRVAADLSNDVLAEMRDSKVPIVDPRRDPVLTTYRVACDRLHAGDSDIILH